MSEVVASEIWGELKRFVNTVDRAEAAETVVQILMDNDSDVDDIRNAFKGDSDIKRALTAYLDNDKDYVDEEDAEEISHDVVFTTNLTLEDTSKSEAIERVKAKFPDANVDVSVNGVDDREFFDEEKDIEL